MKRHLLLAGAALLCGSIASPARAQVATSIVPDSAASGFGTGTQVSSVGPVTQIDGGALRGGNLFHSFRNFDLASGDAARWTTSLADPAGIDNVVNRVTGGQISRIDGTIDSLDLPNATFYFINPAGIVFGPGAAINVPSAAYFSTAQALAFSDGFSFSVSTASGSTFTAAAPAAFGFLAPRGDIVATGGTFDQAAGARLSFSARNVSLVDTVANLTGLELIGVGSANFQLTFGAPPSINLAGRVEVLRSNLFATSSFGAEGGVRLFAGAVLLEGVAGVAGIIQTSPDGGPSGPIEIFADDIEIRSFSLFSATPGDTPGETGGSIRVAADDTLLFDNAFLTTQTSGVAAAGSILLTATEIDIRNSIVDSTSIGFVCGATCAYLAAAGNAGNIVIEALGSVEIADSLMQSTTQGPGLGGAFQILAGESLTILRSNLDSGTLGKGQAGGVILEAPTVFISNSNVTSDADDLFACDNFGCATLPGTGNAGSVSIGANSLTLINSSISSDTRTSGNAGSILLVGSDIIFENASATTSSLFCQSGCTSGPAGNVVVFTDSLSMTSASLLGSDTQTGAIAGNIFIEAVDIELSGADTRISSSTRGSGAAGSISIITGSLAVTDFAALVSSTDNVGRGGSVSILADDILVSGDAQLGSLASGSGSAGSVAITTGSVSVVDSGFLLSSTIGAGNSGTVTIDADEVVVGTEGNIQSLTTSSGDAGRITIRTGSLELFESGSISSQAQSTATGRAGSIDIRADRVDVTSNSFIDSNAFASGDAGSVFMNVTGQLTVEDASISSSTFGGGNAGTVFVRAGEILLFDGDLASVSRGTGNAGSVDVGARRIEVTDFGSISTVTDGIGAGGSVRVDADRLLVAFRGEIDSSTNGSGAAGSVVVDANAIEVVNGGFISSSTSGLGRGGEVIVTADSVLVARTAGIVSETTGPGEAGIVAIFAGALTVEDDGQISSSTFGSASGGTIFIEADTISLNRGGNIQSLTVGDGAAGFILIEAGEVSLRSGSSIDTSTSGSGDAGLLEVDVAGSLLLDDASISSSTSGTGFAGEVIVFASSIQLANGASITSDSTGCADLSCFGGASGFVTLITGELLVGSGSRIGTTSDSDAFAGSILVESNFIRLFEGGRITSNSAEGAAGDITIRMPGDGLLILEGIDRPGVITTSSGPGTGGIIDIFRPLAIISNGGSILAQGAQGGANVLINSEYFISSSDRRNIISVDGAFALESNIYDVSNSAVLQDTSFIDASRVLSGQCAGSRSSGEVSRFSAPVVGPYTPYPISLQPSAPAERVPVASLQREARCS